MTKKKETTVLLLTLLITVGAFAGGLWWLTKNKPDAVSFEQKKTGIISRESWTLSKISTGDEVLV